MYLAKKAASVDERTAITVFIMWQAAQVQQALGSGQAEQAWNEPTMWSGFVRDLMCISLPMPQLESMAHIGKLPSTLRGAAQTRLQSYIQQYKETMLPLMDAFPDLFPKTADFSFERYKWAVRQ